MALVTPPATGATTVLTPTPPVNAGSAQNMQDRKIAFLNASTDKRTVSPDRTGTKPRPRPTSCRRGPSADGHGYRRSSRP